jgi:hypothetical protein
MQCLLDLLRGQSSDRTVDATEWEAALSLAEEHHVLPWATASLRAHDVSLGPELSARVSRIEREAAIAAFYWSAELKGVLHAFEEHGVVVVPLKGPFLAERLYGSTALRASLDLDLLVSKANVARAEAVLIAIGFTPGTPDDYHRQWYRGTTTVELHHDVENPLAFDFHVEQALHRVRPADFEGERCWQLTPEVELLFLCLHGVRHRFERLSLVLDLKLAFEKLGPADAWRPGPETELDSLLILGFAMARRLQPGISTVTPIPQETRQTAHLERLADRLWEQLLTQPSEVLDWRALHAFYLEMELPGSARLGRRWRHAQILLGRVIEPDYKFAARLGLHRTWQARMLRPLRILNDLVRR